MSDDPVISVADLRALQDAGPVTLLDVRWVLSTQQGPPGRASYEDGHLPGAVFVDLDTELADPVGDGTQGRHPLPSPERFVAAMRRAGVRGGVPVVVYDGADGTSAARAWWLLTDYGRSDVRLLDGGYAAWVAAGGAVETGKGQDPADGDFDGTPGHLPVVGTARETETADVLHAADDGVLLDARAGARYRGESEPVDPVAGHIPGAVSAPTTENVRDDGRWRSVDDLRGRFASLGVEPGTPVAVSCGSGVTAAHEIVALRRAGIAAALYPGSWSGWISDPRRPVAAGED